MNPIRNIAFRILVLITTPKLAHKAAEMFRQGAIPVQYEWNAFGTASSEMIDVLGLGTPEKSILTSFMPRPFADTMLKKLKKELKIGSINSGIAFTIPLTGANNLIVHMLKSMDEDGINHVERRMNISMPDIKYSLIAVVVNQGFSDNVMDAARAAGASGGTVVPSRRISNEQAIGFWGMSIQSEKDMIFIVVNNENKLKIMQAISEKCGMHSEAKGILVSLPIDNVIGLEDAD